MMDQDLPPLRPKPDPKKPRKSCLGQPCLRPENFLCKARARFFFLRDEPRDFFLRNESRDFFSSRGPLSMMARDRDLAQTSSDPRALMSVTAVMSIMAGSQTHRPQRSRV